MGVFPKGLQHKTARADLKLLQASLLLSQISIAQFRHIKIQLKTIDLSPDSGE